MKTQSTIRLTSHFPRLISPLSLLLFSFLLSAFCFTPRASAQAPGYSREEVSAREQAVREEGIPARRSSDSGGRDMLMSGSQSIGSARSKVRGGGGGQSAMLRYDQHREITPPGYATVRIGPLYSNLGISQSAGYRYIRISGSGVDFLTGSSRGEFLKDGSDFPLVSTLSLDNYLIITRRIDLSANIEVSYAHYPLKTQEDEFRVDLTDEGVYGTFSSEFQPSRDTRLLLYDDILYRTDYIDTRGSEDRYGGQEYEHLENTVGADWDWQPSPFDNFSLSVSRIDVVPFDDEFGEQERVGYAEAISYQRQLSRFATAGVLGTFSQSIYDDELRPDIYLYGISGFTAARLTRRLTGSASLGYQFSSYSGGESDSDGRGTLSGSLGLNHAISESKSQDLTYQRTQAEAFSGGVDVRDAVTYGLSWKGGLLPGGLTSQFSSFSPQDSERSGYSDWSTSLNLQHQLTRLLRLDLTTSYDMRMNEASPVSSDPDTPDLTSDYQTWTIRLGTRMRLSKKTSFDAYAEHADRMSDNDDLAYTRDVIAANLTWTHKF